VGFLPKQNGLIQTILFISFLTLPYAAKAEWRFDPVFTKLKWSEKQDRWQAGGGWGYYTSGFRWTHDWRWRKPTSSSEPAYYQSELRGRIGNDWWLGTTGRYAIAPNCDFYWVEVELEKTRARPAAFSLWGEGEWRRVTAGATLEDYDQQIVGSRLRWQLLPQLQWTGELTREWKTYPTPRKSSLKTALSHEVTWRVSPHTFLGRWAESTRIYPDDAWKNYYYQSIRLEWKWNIKQKAFMTAKGGYNWQSQGSGKEGGKFQFTGILDYPFTPEYKVSWLVSTAKTIDSYILIPEEEETEPTAADWRLGLRWQDFSPPLTIRAELFCVWSDVVTGGWLVRLQSRRGRIGWTLGLAPRGGFYPNEEKGYWLEVKYYLD